MAKALKGKAAELFVSRLKAANLKGLLTGWRRSIKGKLLFWLLLISLAPMAIIAYLSYSRSSEALQRQSFENLETTLAFQHQALQTYFSEQEKDLQNISETMQLLQKEAHIKLAAVRDLQKKQITDYFAMRYQNVQSFAGNPEQKNVFADLLKNASAQLDSAFAEYLTGWLEVRDFASLSLLSPDGKVLYSTSQDMPRGATVREKTAEAEALRKGTQETVFIDYAQSSFQLEGSDKTVAYFATPFTTIEGQLQGVLLFSLKGSALDDITRNPPGLGDQGESYLVGIDGMFRSNSRYFAEPTLANPAFVVDTESVVYALSGESGAETTINYRGDYVLSSYTAVELYGTTWVLIVDLDQADAVAPKTAAGDKESDHLRELAEHYGYPNLYLINPDGYIFYSANQQQDHLTNILTGPYSSTNFGTTAVKALNKKEITISDYSFYEPAGGKPAAFLVAPIISKDTVIMFAAMQVPIDQINAVMDIRKQFEGGSSHKHEEEMVIADTYLIGSDKLWRSESSDAKKYGVDRTLLNPKTKVETEAVTEALAGKDNTKVIVNGAGEEVLSSWTQFKYKDLSWAVISEAKWEAVHQPVTTLIRIIGIAVFAAIVLITVVSLLVASGVTKQVGEIMEVMVKVEQGDYSGRAEVTSKDELGRLAGDFNTMTDTIESLLRTREAEHEKLNASIIQLLEEITQLADGDLTIRATVTDDVIGTLADSLNLMLDNLGRAFRRIKDSAEQVGSTANVLSSSTGELAEQNNAQSKMINEAVEKIGLLTEEIRKAADKAVQSAGSSKESSHVAEDGAAAVRETSQAMEAIRSNVQNTARAIKRLGESSQEISDFARNINEISDRTSILALNASIQAAAAGEEGRGFAVVAEEIQRLAERAAVSTRQIETLIRNILGEITEAGVSMDASIQEVVQGTKLSQNALAKLEEITTRSNEVAELIEDVALASKEQAGTTATLAGKMTDIGQISLETAQETMGASISMREMAAMGDDMLEAVAAFRLEKPAPSA